MTNSQYLRSSLAQAALEHVPPLIRKTLIEQRDFREEYGFNVDAVITFGDAGISIRRSELFDAIRQVLARSPEIVVTDSDRRDWTVFAEGREGEQPRILISNDDQRIRLPDFTGLSPDRATRLRSLQVSASDVNLPSHATSAWRDILARRSLEDEEVDQLLGEFRDTPVHFARSIRAEFQKGQSSVPSLVPLSRRYFDRLVGKYNESASIKDYAAGPGKIFMEELCRRQPYDGFLSSLFLSSHSALTTEISVEHMERESLVRAFEFLVDQGDKLSQLGGVEVGMRVLTENREIEPSIVRLIEQIRDDDVDDPTSGFSLFSALFILVDGELSRARLYADVPPYYRRLASLAQAALIQREIVASSVKIETFYEWAVSNRGEHFYFQSLVDMRLEPRWNPSFSSPAQIKADFFGRLLIGAKNSENQNPSGILHELLLGDEPSSVRARSDYLRPYFPGPLEGDKVNQVDLPEEFSEIVENQLGADEVGASSFVALVNSGLLFRIGPDQTERAAEALRLASHRLAKVDSRAQLLAVLNGLAIVAAVSRGKTLADELRILVRRYRRDPEYALTMEEAFQICLVASASRQELTDWRNSTGDWLTELAFDNFHENEADGLYSSMQYLCHAVPQLWFSCGKADAALKSYLHR